MAGRTIPQRNHSLNVATNLRMTIKELHNELKKRNISEDKYYLQGLYGSTNDDNKIALTAKMGKYTAEYQVYYKERGEKHSERNFTTEKEACEYVMNKILEQHTIEKTQNIIGLEGMTVNERLYTSGLMDEFDRAKRKNKTRAYQILRILKVDKPSIDKILNKKNWWQQWL